MKHFVWPKEHSPLWWKPGKQKHPKRQTFFKDPPEHSRNTSVKTHYVCCVKIDAYCGLCVTSRSGRDFCIPKTLALNGGRPASRFWNQHVCGHSETMNIVLVHTHTLTSSPSHYIHAHFGVDLSWCGAHVRAHVQHNCYAYQLSSTYFKFQF